MEKGIVLEHEGSQVVVLTPEGKFKRIKVDGELPAIGEEIAIKPVANAPVFLPTVIAQQRMWMAAAAAVFLILFVPFGFRYFASTAPAAAYLSMDINPSLELELDKNGKVVRSESLNPDGKKLLGASKIRGLKAEDAVDNLVGAAVSEGYIAQGKENLVVVSLTKASDNTKLPSDISAQVKKSTAQLLADAGIAGTVETVETTTDVREEAKKAGLSTGKFAVYLAARDTGLDVEIEALKKEAIGAVIKDAGGSPKTLLFKAHSETDYTAMVEKYCGDSAVSSGSNMLVNGSFEQGSFSGWEKGGVYEQSIVDRGAYDGQCAALLGRADYDGSDIPVGLNWLSREVQLPEKGEYISLKFWYRLETYDGLERDSFTVLLKDSRGKTLETLFRSTNKGVHGIKQDLEWKQVKVDLSKYRGQLVKLVFGLTNGDRSENTWVTVDGVQVNFQ